ncbi:MAG: ABC transporter ATP-binding protein [Desulfatibacillaceae bacterium]
MVKHGGTALVEGLHLAFSYGRRQILADLCLALHPGELVGVIGPNGSGKSTLMALLSGALAPKSGSVRLNGEVLGNIPRRRIARLLGVVTQTPQMCAGFSVMETVLSGRFAHMGWRMFENPEDLDAAGHALRLTGLEELANRAVGDLSGGERQRTALARALVARPRALFLDEPTSALDMNYQLRILDMLEDACTTENLGVLMVSHDVNLAALYCDRLYLLSDGRVLAEGPPESVITAGNLHQAYGIHSLVDREPTRHRPRVTLIPRAEG